MQQIRRIRCNKEQLRYMCDRIFDVRQLPDGVENMEEGFEDVLSWVAETLAASWESGDIGYPEEKEEDIRRDPEPADDDPFLRFMGIFDDGEEAYGRT